MENKFNHFDENGSAVMVDVSEKEVTHREAKATGVIKASNEVIEAVINAKVSKGDVLGVARIGGIMAVKKTSELIPMSHPLAITKAAIDFSVNEKEGFISAECTVKTEGKTGVEMEALCGVSTALLSIYDMCKAIDKRMVISDIHLVEKTGGKSGHFKF